MYGEKNNKTILLYAMIIFLAGMLTTSIWIGGKNETTLLAQSNGTNPGNYTTTNPFVGADTIEKIVNKAGPAVVKIESTIKVQRENFRNPFLDDPFFREFFGDELNINPGSQLQKGLGSGFIISKDGYIVTNNHVIEGASDIKVYLTNNKEPLKAKLIGSDAQLDLAVLKINATKDLPILKFGDTNKLKVGNWVIAIGNPYGLDHTVTVGVISAKGRPLTVEGTSFKNLLQTDASINPGNSGGPLINLNGEVIGINTAVNTAGQGIGFAIPSSTVNEVLDQLIQKGKVSRPFLGITMQDLDKDIADYLGYTGTSGALVTSVVKDSPAYKGGIKRGDIIVEYNKTKVTSSEDLKNLVTKSKIGDQAVLVVFREGKNLYLTTKIAEQN